MTEFLDDTEGVIVDLDELATGKYSGKAPPLDVRIVGSIVDKPEGTEFASIQSYVLLGTETQPSRILAQDLLRKRAVIIISPGNAGNITGFVRIGPIGDVQNSQGGILVNGNTLVLENGRAWYVLGDGSHSLTVTVLDERYSAGGS